MRGDYVTPSVLEPMGPERLVNADGRDLVPLGRAILEVRLPYLTTHQAFVVVEHLSAPTIQGCDFLTKHGLIIDFATSTYHSRASTMNKGKLSLRSANSCMLLLDEECLQAMPLKYSSISQLETDHPSHYHPSLGPVLKGSSDCS